MGHEDPLDLPRVDPGPQNPRDEPVEATRGTGLDHRPPLGTGEQEARDQALVATEPEVQHQPPVAELGHGGRGHSVATPSGQPKTTMRNRIPANATDTMNDAAHTGALHRRTFRPSSGPYGIRLKAANHAFDERQPDQEP